MYGNQPPPPLFRNTLQITKGGNLTDAEVDEALRVEERSLHHLPQLLNLLLAPAHIAVGHVRLLLNLKGWSWSQHLVKNLLINL